MHRNRLWDSGVSEVVGEMLMIALVVVLLSVFAAALYHYMPPDRDPSVTIRMDNDTLGNISLWHKGGDWVNAEDLTVVLMNDSGRMVYRYNETFTLPLSQFLMVQPGSRQKKTFDLGSNLTVRMREDLWTHDEIRTNMTIKLLTPKSVIYTGRITP